MKAHDNAPTLCTMCGGRGHDNPEPWDDGFHVRTPCRKCKGTGRAARETARERAEAVAAQPPYDSGTGLRDAIEAAILEAERDAVARVLKRLGDEDVAKEAMNGYAADTVLPQDMNLQEKWENKTRHRLARALAAVRALLEKATSGG